MNFYYFTLNIWLFDIFHYLYDNNDYTISRGPHYCNWVIESRSLSGQTGHQQFGLGWTQDWKKIKWCTLTFVLQLSISRQTVTSFIITMITCRPKFIDCETFRRLHFHIIYCSKPHRTPGRLIKVAGLGRKVGHGALSSEVSAPDCH